MILINFTYSKKNLINFILGYNLICANLNWVEMGLKSPKPKHNIYYNSISFFFFFFFSSLSLPVKERVSCQLKLNFFFHPNALYSLSISFLLHCLLFTFCYFNFFFSTIFFLLLLCFRASKCTKLLFSLSNTVFNVIFNSAFLLQNNLVSSYLKIFYIIFSYLLLPSLFLIFLLFLVKSLFFTVSLCYNFSLEQVFRPIYRFRPEFKARRN